MRQKKFLRYMKLWFNKNLKSPIYLTFFITTRCNARCKYCFFWKELNSKKKELTLKEIEKISKSMDNLLFLLLSGGEPFLRKDIDELVKIFYRNNHPPFIVIPTNGILTEIILEKIRSICDKCPKSDILISVSLDGPEEITDKTRNVKGSFKKTVQTIIKLKELKKPNLSVGVSLTFNAINQNQILDFYEYLKKEIKPDLISPLLIRGKPREDFTKKVNLKIYKELQDRIEKDYLKKTKRGNLGFSKIVVANRIIRAERIYKTALKNRFLSPCYAGIINAIIYPDGKITPCEILDEEFGNIKDYDYDFKKLWQSSRVKKFREKIRKEKCFCTHECNWTTNILFNPAYLPRLLWTASRELL